MKKSVIFHLYFQILNSVIFKDVFPTFIITGCVLTAINSWNETLNSGLSTLYIAAWTIFIIGSGKRRGFCRCCRCCFCRRQTLIREAFLHDLILFCSRHFAKYVQQKMALIHPVFKCSHAMSTSFTIWGLRTKQRSCAIDFGGFF